jgi:tetratricopeptide (TPR) repeat protein
VTLLGKAIALDPGKPEPYLDLGSAWLRLQKYDNAETAFRRAIELRPKGKGYHFALGIVLETTGRCEEALKEFKLELANYPDDESVKRQLATTTCGAAK